VVALPTSKPECALYWAQRGFFIFPGEDGGKRPRIKDNLKLATTDEIQIRAWWTQWPEANICAVPGKSGHFVLDVDVKGYGHATLFRLEEQHGSLPKTLTVSTPSGGAHYWFLGQAATTARKLGPGLDTRGGETGYVLMPGSVLSDGGRYELA
jgi:hypothetical protein